MILLTGTVLTSQSKKFCDLNPLCRIKYEIQPFSEFGQKKRPLDTLNHRTLVYSHGIKSCDSCASKRHLSRVTLYITLQALLLLPCCSSPYICAFPSTVFCRSGFVHRSHSLKFFHRQFPPLDSDSRVVSILPLLGFD